MAARLLRIPDSRRRDVASGRCRGLLVEEQGSGGTGHRPRTRTGAIEAVQLALAEAEALLPEAQSLIEYLTDPDTGEIVPITLVTDNGGPFRSFRFEAFIASRPELRHVRTRVKSPGQNGVWERAFGSLKCERLYREQIDDALDLVREAEAFRIEFNEVRPHEHLAWNRPRHIHLPSPTRPHPPFPSPKPCQLLDAGHPHTRNPAVR